MLQWVANFSPVEPLPPTEIHLDYWEAAQVLYFLKYVDLTVKQGEYKSAYELYGKHFRKLSGSNAKRYVDNDCSSTIKDINHVYELRDMFELLKEAYKGIFNQEEFTILSKLYRMGKQHTVFLTSNFVKVLKEQTDGNNTSMLTRLKDIAQCLNNSEKYFSLVGLFKKNNYIMPVAHERNLQEKVVDEDEKLLKKQFSDVQEKFIRIKLVFTPTTSPENLIQELNTQIVHEVSAKLRNYLTTPFGTFHASVLVGDYLLEYNDSGLVIPRNFNRKRSLFIMDICKPLPDTPENRAKIHKAAFSVAKEYNTLKQYCNVPKNNRNLGNCQSFAQDLIAALKEELNLEILLDQKGCIYNYLNYLRTTIHPKLLFKPSIDFINYTDCSSSIEFKSHCQLDDFVSNLSHKFQEKKFMDSYPQEYFLLKAFDRFFWTKLIYTTVKDFAPEREIDEEAKIECIKLKEICKPSGFQITGVNLLGDMQAYKVDQNNQKMFQLGSTCNCFFKDPRTASFEKHL